jgi:hypothetical protein
MGSAAFQLYCPVTFSCEHGMTLLIIQNNNPTILISCLRRSPLASGNEDPKGCYNVPAALLLRIGTVCAPKGWYNVCP